MMSLQRNIYSFVSIFRTSQLFRLRNTLCQPYYGCEVDFSYAITSSSYSPGIFTYTTKAGSRARDNVTNKLHRELFRDIHEIIRKNLEVRQIRDYLTS